MNYSKIYSDFIADRREKESALSGYSEKHHIVPRSLGGANGKENIILLTASDHYFAHLCLAKIHGGVQWAGVFAMSNLHVSKKRKKRLASFRQRKLVSVSRKRFAEWQRDRVTGVLYRDRQPKVTLYNCDGRSIHDSQASISDATGLLPATVFNLVSGKSSFTKSGWYFNKQAMLSAKKEASERGRAMIENTNFNRKKIINCDTGEVFASSVDAAKSCGKTNSRNIRKVCSNERTTAFGFNWRYA